ncbi:MAG: hypothetical protein JWR16_636 [Nevskia sp.]|nr:hypothetical protein [Nevskia sp.]
MKRFILTTALLLSSCASAANPPAVAAHITSRVIPTPYAPQHDDAIAIVLAPTSSTEDQTLTALLASELPRMGFHTVDSPENARWILQGSYMLLTRSITADAPTADAEPQLLEDREADVRLTLYSVTEFINGERAAVWTSTYYGMPELYQLHPRTLIRLLLQKFGSDFDGNLHAVEADEHDTEHH